MVSKILRTSTEKRPVRTTENGTASGACLIHAIGTIVMLLMIGFVTFIYEPSLGNVATGMLVGGGVFALYLLLLRNATPAPGRGYKARIVSLGAFAAVVVLAFSSPDVAVFRERPWIVLAAFIVLALYFGERTVHFRNVHRSDDGESL